jgi:hypothetical protein
MARRRMLFILGTAAAQTRLTCNAGNRKQLGETVLHLAAAAVVSL